MTPLLSPPRRPEPVKTIQLAGGKSLYQCLDAAAFWEAFFLHLFDKDRANGSIDGWLHKLARHRSYLISIMGTL